jgi:hypothetical protein
MIFAQIIGSITEIDQVTDVPDANSEQRPEIVPLRESKVCDAPHCFRSISTRIHFE